MTFLADEDVDRQIVERLRLDGHQVAYVAEMSPGIIAWRCRTSNGKRSSFSSMRSFRSNSLPQWRELKSASSRPVY